MGGGVCRNVRKQKKERSHAPAPASGARFRAARPRTHQEYSRGHQHRTRGLGDPKCLVKHQERADQLHAEHDQAAAERKGDVQGECTQESRVRKHADETREVPGRQHGNERARSPASRRKT